MMSIFGGGGAASTGEAAGALAAFALTNGADWAFGNDYPRTLAGLTNCYIAGWLFDSGKFLGVSLAPVSLFGWDTATSHLLQYVSSVFGLVVLAWWTWVLVKRVPKARGAV